MRVVAEFTVEPFVEGSPGPHVAAAIDAVRVAGVDVDVGPFGTTAVGEHDVVAGALARLCHDALAAGAERISLQISVVSG